MSKYMILTNSNELVRVLPERIAYISSDGNYSTMVLIDNAEHLFSLIWQPSRKPLSSSWAPMHKPLYDWEKV